MARKMTRKELRNTRDEAVVMARTRAFRLRGRYYVAMISGSVGYEALTLREMHNYLLTARDAFCSFQFGRDGYVARTDYVNSKPVKRPAGYC